MKMKLYLGIIVAVLGIGFLAHAVVYTDPTGNNNVNARRLPDPEGVFKTRSFLVGDAVGYTNAGTSLIVTNCFGSTNVYTYKRVPAGLPTSSSYTYFTNAAVNPFQWYYYTNTTYTNFYQQIPNQAAWQDVEAIPDYGSYSNTVVWSVAKAGLTSGTTNSDIYRLYRTTSGLYYDTNTVISMTLLSQGTSLVISNYVLPSSFVVGARGFRMEIEAGTNSPATTNFVSAAGISALGR